MDGTIAKVSILVKISGNGVSPATVRASDLADLISNLEIALTEAAIDSGELDAELISDNAEVSLVSIREGSTDLGVALAPAIVPATNRIFRALLSSETNLIGSKSYDAFTKIHKQFVRHSWALSIRHQDEPRFDFGELIISNVIPFPEKKIRTTRGGTTIYGKLMRFGNARPTASIILDDRSRVSVEMSRQMVKDLESRHQLFTRVGFEGLATWSLPEWKIIDFGATRITGFQSTGDHLNKMFDELGRLSEDRWNEIDPVAYVKNIRGGDRS